MTDFISFGSIKGLSRLLVAAMLAASPDAFAQSVSTYYQTAGGLAGATTSSSTATSLTSTTALDANNYAEAVNNSAAGTVGVGVFSDGTYGATTVNAHGALDEDWTCTSGACLTGTTPVDVTYSIFLSGTLSQDWLNPPPDDYTFFGARLNFNGGYFEIDWYGTAAGPTGGGGMEGQLCVFLSPCTYSTIASTVLANGSLSFNTNVLFAGTLTTTAEAGFTTGLLLSAGADPISRPSAVSFLDTAGFNIISADSVWTADSGRTSLPPPDSGGGTPVPEPTTLSLLTLGLAGLAFTRRRKQQSTSA